MRKLLVATGNRGKLVEIQALLEHLDVELVTPDQLGIVLDVEEDGSTYAENAARKARAYLQVSGLGVLADDSGLEVDALGGLPGIRSARFSPIPNATDQDRRAYLLSRLQSFARPWTARFRCVVAVATPGSELQYAEGICPGEIIPEERGEHGFGYDPIFLLPESGQTMAELSMDEKNLLSHRALAVKAAIPILLSII